MEVIKKKLGDLTEEEFHVRHLQIINLLLPVNMTQKELEVLALFMSLDGQIVKKDRFGTTARKIVMEKLNISSGGLGNYLKALKDKKIIYYNEFNVLEANRHLFPDSPKQGYNILIEKEDESKL